MVHEIGYYYFFFKEKGSCRIEHPRKTQNQKPRMQAKDQQGNDLGRSWGRGNHHNIFYDIFSKKKPKTKTNSLQITANLDFILRTESFVLK